MEQVVARSPHSIDLENVPMGLHELGVDSRRRTRSESTRLMEAATNAILLGYAVRGRGTEGLRAGKMQLVLPRLHAMYRDC